jgi:FAD:protein FMN transferase
MTNGVPLHHVELVMGMAVTIDVRDPYVPGGAVTEVVDWLHHVDAAFSPYRDDSPITQFGRGLIARDDLSPEVRGVLDLCEVARVESAGAFDVFKQRSPNGTNFDPCGLVKGWSVQRAAAILESWSAENFSINAGGDLVLRGSPNPGSDEPWRTGIRHPELADQLACVVSAVGPLAIATSAAYERGHHIIDPRTGSAATGLTSVTVVGPDLTWVDTYATAAFVLGLDSLAWIEAHDGYGAYAITPDGMTHRTPTFNSYL